MASSATHRSQPTSSSGESDPALHASVAALRELSVATDPEYSHAGCEERSPESALVLWRVFGSPTRKRIGPVEVLACAVFDVAFMDELVPPARSEAHE